MPEKDAPAGGPGPRSVGASPSRPAEAVGRLLLVATRNQGKLRELRRLLAGAPYRLVSLDEAGIETEVEETGATLEENAALKARAYCLLSGLPTLADDSGLEVEALGGAPGVHSSRWAGQGATDADRIAFLLRKLENVKGPWRARFRCVIAVAWPGEAVELYEGVCPGVIVPKPRGEGGFGYDPVFYLPELGRTMAQLSPEEKDRVSHRGRAAREALKGLLRRVTEGDIEGKGGVG